MPSFFGVFGGLIDRFSRSAPRLRTLARTTVPHNHLRRESPGGTKNAAYPDDSCRAASRWPRRVGVDQRRINTATEAINDSTREPADYALAAKDPALSSGNTKPPSHGSVFAGGAGATAFALILLTLGTASANVHFPRVVGDFECKGVRLCRRDMGMRHVDSHVGARRLSCGRLRNRWLGVDADEIHSATPHMVS
ncbi:hypothetical protein ACFFYR_37400 [Paraburkholderia dipogonis]|uniref:hypothetical protein n=1 Tax=Paraburkholderia dipogonis TaxID=1211383 RepID=UPI0035EBCBE3